MASPQKHKQDFHEDTREEQWRMARMFKMMAMYEKIADLEMESSMVAAEIKRVGQEIEKAEELRRQTMDRTPNDY